MKYSMMEKAKNTFNKIFYNISPIYAETQTYYLDEDSLQVEKEQLAYKIGKEILDNGLINFSITTKRNSIGSKIYTIGAKALIKKVD